MPNRPTKLPYILVLAEDEVGFIEVSLQELRNLLRIKACLGIVDDIDKLWAIEEMKWDIAHVEHAIDMLTGDNNANLY